MRHSDLDVDLVRRKGVGRDQQEERPARTDRGGGLLQLRYAGQIVALIVPRREASLLEAFREAQGELLVFLYVADKHIGHV